MERLDTSRLIIHTDEFVRKGFRKDECCVPRPVVLVEEKKSFIIRAETRCLDYDTYYTLQINRETPYEAWPLNTFILVEPCGFHRGEVGLDWTKTVHEIFCEGGPMEPTSGEGHERIVTERLGEHGHGDGRLVTHGHLGRGGIPADPAFPAQNFVGFERKEKSVLVPVSLDLHGQIANGKNFATGEYKVPGTGLPYQNRFVLFYNNRGVFVLSRDWQRRSDYA